MKQRINQGYTIIVSVLLPECEYVLDEKQMETREPKYVTWYCVNQKDYYHGHYIDDKNVAMLDLYKRAHHELAYRIDKLNEIIKGEI